MATTATTANKSVFSFWWAPLLEGLAAIGFGAALFLQPAITLIVLTTFLGAYWLVDGLFKVVAAFSGRDQSAVGGSCSCPGWASSPASSSARL